MSYLVRFRAGKPHFVAHRVHEIDGVVGALCSKVPKPAEGDHPQSGEWRLVDKLPADVRICQHCQKIQHKLDNPLPARVERDLEKLALWDPRAAALQREKMLQYYRQKQAQRGG